MTEDDDYENGLDLIIPKKRRRSDVLFRIREELEKESDRGCALVSAAYLENELSILLKIFFIDQGKDTTKVLFDFNGPVGTFSAKIKMANALGLLPTEIKTELERLRSIRNDFAHLQEHLTFESKSISSQINNMRLVDPDPSQSIRNRFIDNIIAIASSVHLSIANVDKRRVPEYIRVRAHNGKEDHDLELAAHRIMGTIAPPITFEQAIEMARRLKDFK